MMEKEFKVLNTKQAEIVWSFEHPGNSAGRKGNFQSNIRNVQSLSNQEVTLIWDKAWIHTARVTSV